jgi:xylan 1,4-beta-xylosidase
MLGDPDSCGIWAPCLSYADGLYWLIYTDVKRFGRTTVGGASGASMRDFHNYLVTSPRIDGDWSDPVHLNSSGFDPSLFHDDDGHKYLLNMLWDHRPGNNRFAGIVLQEYSVKERKLIGQRKTIFTGTPLGFTEAPHLYKRNGWYYLLTAEGGRETAIQKMIWGRDDWLRTLDGQGVPTVKTPGPSLPNLPLTCPPDTLSSTGGEGAIGSNSHTLCRYDFDKPQLAIDFQWLRTPRPEEIFSLTARPGFLRLLGRETIGSLFRQSLVARRQQSHCFSAATVVEFDPEHFQQLAGLVCYYNSAKFHYLHISHNDTVGKHLRVMSCVPDSPQTDAFTPPIAISAGKPVHLRV